MSTETESRPSTLNVRNPRAELHTEQIGVQQKPTVETRADIDTEIVTATTGLGKGYAADLAFGEDPVTIRIERSSEKHAAPMIDCWVNGKGAEVLTSRGWIELGYLLVGVPLTTKRKYVEVLARAKHDTINTKVEDATVENPKNEIERYSSSRAPFSVIKDENPRGAEWLTNLVRYL